MTQDEFKALINRAESGDKEAMKKAAFVLLEIADQHLKNGNLDLAKNCIDMATGYRNKL